MANTTLTVAADAAIVDSKLVAACSGIQSMPGASVKAFIATAGDGTYPVAGLTLDLSDLFSNKILAVVINGLYDPAATTGDLLFPAIYIPDDSGDPASGVVKCYCSNGAANAGLLMVPNETVTIKDYVVTGFAIGY